MTITRSFPWRFGSFLLLLALTGLIAVDVQKHGSFKACSTGRFLQDVGALKYGEQAWERTRYYSDQGYGWAKENIPAYYKLTSERAKPYLLQVKDSALVVGSYANQTYWNAYAYTQEKAPLVKAWVNQYAPGLIDTVQAQSVKLWLFTKEQSILVGDFVVKQSHSAFNWAKTNVFVGKLSPENLQQYSQDAINTTQVYAAWTYDWVREKVHTLSKVQ